MAPAAEENEGKMQHSCFKLFTFREAGTQVSLVTMSGPFSRTVAPPPCLLLDIKDSLKEDMGFWGFFSWGLIYWRAACTNAAAAAELC
jgi:hypothetical protein